MTSVTSSSRSASPVRRLSARAVVMLTVLASGGAVVQAEDSPFLPSGFGAPAAPVAAASPLDRFEFRGVMTIGAETMITLVDTSNSRSLSILLGATIEGVTATDFQRDDGSVQVASAGQVKRLKLRESKIIAMAAPPPAPPPPPGGVPPMVPGQPPGANAVNATAAAPMSDEEARARMQRVAEEIRRRREMRRQMLETQQTQGGQPTNR